MAPTKATPRAKAEQIANRLAEVPAVLGICLFGSVSRGDHAAWSDIDFLVVGLDRGLSPSSLLRALSPELRRERVSILYYLPTELQEMAASGSSFIAHLRKEGDILFDSSGLLTEVLRPGADVPVNVDEELDARLAQLTTYEDPSLFNGNFLFPLARIYSIGKSIVMLALAAEGAGEFRRDAAFATFKKRHPELASEVDKVVRLRPFYRLVTRRGSEPLPFSYRVADRQLSEAVGAIRELARVLK